MLPEKIFKIKGPSSAKNRFSEISAWKNQIELVGYIIDTRNSSDGN